MRKFWNRLVGMPDPSNGRPRLTWAERPAVIYAIGDVHGCLDVLKRLEDLIAADAANYPGDKMIVMLGDYIDRGPKSAQVLDWLMRPAPTGFARICLAGNHEAMFLDAMAQPDRCGDWLQWGGRQTLESYRIDVNEFDAASTARRRALLQASVPDEHRSFLTGLPVLLEVPGALFVHAGVRGDLALEQQRDADLQWMREPFLSTPIAGFPVVVHGHTPSPLPEILPWRIGVDTQAYATGKLTAVRLLRDGPPEFIQT